MNPTQKRFSLIRAASKSHFLSVLTILLLATKSAFAAATVAVSFTGGTFDNTADDTAGFRFTVGSSDISVSALGFYDQGANGLSDAHPVAIFDAITGLPLLSAAIPSGVGATLESGFRFVQVAPVTLRARTTYVINGYRPTAADGILYNVSNLTTPSFLTYNTEVAANGTGGLVFTNTPFGASNGWFGPNFKADVVSRAEHPVEWITRYGTANQDYGRSVTVDPAGKIWVAGETFGSLGGASAGQSDVFLSRLSTNGSVDFTRQRGGSDEDFANGVAVVGNDTVFAAGGTRSSTIDGQTSLGQTDNLAVRYTTGGAWLGTASFGTSGYDEIAGAAGNATHLLIAGFTEGSFDGQVNSGNGDAFLSKRDSAGALVWTRFVGTSEVEGLAAAAFDLAGNAYLAGTTSGSLNGSTNAGEEDLFVARYGGTGSRTLLKQIGGTRGEFPRAIEVDGSGNIYLTGSTSGDLGGQTHLGVGMFDSDAFVMKLDNTGNVLWTRLLGGSGEDECRGIGVDAAGHVWIGGFSDNALGRRAATPSHYDAFVAEFDSNGLLLDTTFLADLDGLIQGLKIGPDGSVYVAGFGYKPGTPNPNEDVFVAKVRNVPAFSGHAAILQASDGSNGAGFGDTVSLSGTSSLVGSPYGSGLPTYLFRNLDTAIGTVTESAKLTASDTAGLGFSVGLSGGIGIATSPGATVGSIERKGVAYLFRNLETATGTVTETARLVSSDGDVNYLLGVSVSVAGNAALIAAADAGSGGQRGALYLFRNLDTATGTVTQTAKLRASDGVAGDNLGVSVSFTGSAGLAGADTDDSFRGSAYVFRNLDTASGNVTESVKLTASDRAENDDFGPNFGHSVSLSGSTGLVGAPSDDTGTNSDQGSAYLFRNLNAATGIITQNAKLVASDGAANDIFGLAVSLSGSVGLITAPGTDSARGSAYIFRNLDTASGAVTESVKLTASIAAVETYFGWSVSLDGDRFVIGAPGGDGTVARSGKAFTGTLSSVTTLNRGNAIEGISGLSFTSRTDWIVGETSDTNQVNLGVGDKATVTAAGKAVFIGRNAGSDGNSLRINGTLTANEVYIGALAGNRGNILQLEDTSAFNALAFRLAPDNMLRIKGDYTAIGNLLTYLDTTALKVWNGSGWQDVNSSNYGRLISSSFNSGYTAISSKRGADYLKISNVRQALPSRRVSFDFGTEVDKSYQVEISIDLQTWTPLGTPLLALAHTFNFAEETDPPAGTALRFYRVREL
ncbi:MAG: SBBP repeat-containing protein [Opitutaceae bacterium]